jgi:hypothetical protein
MRPETDLPKRKTCSQTQQQTTRFVPVREKRTRLLFPPVPAMRRCKHNSVPGPRSAQWALIIVILLSPERRRKLEGRRSSTVPDKNRRKPICEQGEAMSDSCRRRPRGEKPRRRRCLCIPHPAKERERPADPALFRKPVSYALMRASIRLLRRPGILPTPR